MLGLHLHKAESKLWVRLPPTHPKPLVTLRSHQARTIFIKEGGPVRTTWDEKTGEYRGFLDFDHKKAVCLFSLCVGQLCVCACVFVCVCLNTIFGLCSLHLQLRDIGAKMMDLLINIFIHFKI